MRRAEGDAKLFGVFRVKNHDFKPKNHIFSNFFFGGGGARRVRPHGSTPVRYNGCIQSDNIDCLLFMNDSDCFDCAVSCDVLYFTVCTGQCDFQIKSYKVINTQIYSKHPVIHFTSSV